MINHDERDFTYLRPILELMREFNLTSMHVNGLSFQRDPTPQQRLLALSNEPIPAADIPIPQEPTSDLDQLLALMKNSQ